MSLNSINTNYAASIALQSLNNTSTQLQKTEKAISTGYRVADAVDDGAAYAVAQRVRSDVGALTSANQQLGNVKGLITTTVSALNDVSNALNSARDLLVKLADSNTVATQRTQYSSQYIAIVSQIKSFFTDATYNTKSLIGNIGATAGFGSVQVIRNEVGATYGIATFSGSVLVSYIRSYISGGSVSSANAKTAIGTGTGSAVFTSVLSKVGGALNTYGSAANYVDNQVSFNNNKIDSLNSGLGSLVDADLAKEAAQLQALQTRQQLGTQSLSIANQAPQSLLSLFK